MSQLTKTKKPISSVSYNTEEYLKLKLNELIQAKLIDFWVYIKHKGEINYLTGEVEKDHIHLYITPLREIQLYDITEYFNEIDVNNILPLKCMPFRTSNFENWYLYGLHDKNFLREIKETKQYHYKTTDFVSSNSDILSYYINEQINYNKYIKNEQIINAINNGLNPFEMFKDGLININNAVAANILYRYNKENNEIKIE